MKNENKGGATSTAPKKTEKVKHENVYAALSALQGELSPFEKSAKVEFEKKNGGKVEFTYTPLGDIFEELYPLMGKHGLYARHEMVRDDGKDFIVAVLTHESAKWVEVEKITEVEGKKITEKVRVLEGEVRSGPVKIYVGDDMKDTGAAITYARRYSLTMALGIASEEDMDAKIVEESGKNAIKFAYGKAKKGVQDAKTAKDLDKALKVLKDDKALLEKGKAPALGLSADQYDELIKAGEEKKVELEKTEGAGGAA